MMYNERDQIGFIEIPKTGSSAMVKMLAEYGYRQHTFPYMKQDRHASLVEDPWTTRGVRTFAVHRNPWDRMASAWRAYGLSNVRTQSMSFFDWFKTARFIISGHSLTGTPQIKWGHYVGHWISYEHP